MSYAVVMIASSNIPAFVNPLAVHSRQAPGEPIPSTQLAAFTSARNTLLSRLTTVLAEGPRPKPDAVAAAAR